MDSADRNNTATIELSEVILEALKNIRYEGPQDARRLKGALQDLTWAYPPEKKFKVIQHVTDKQCIGICGKAISASDQQLEIIRENARRYLRQECMLADEWAEMIAVAMTDAFAAYGRGSSIQRAADIPRIPTIVDPPQPPPKKPRRIGLALVIGAACFLAVIIGITLWQKSAPEGEEAGPGVEASNSEPEYVKYKEGGLIYELPKNLDEEYSYELPGTEWGTVSFSTSSNRPRTDWKEELEIVDDDYTVLDSGKMTVDGKTCYWFERQFEWSDDEDWQKYLFLPQNKGSGCVQIEVECEKENQAVGEEAFEELIRDLRFTDQAVDEQSNEEIIRFGIRIPAKGKVLKYCWHNYWGEASNGDLLYVDVNFDPWPEAVEQPMEEWSKSEKEWIEEDEERTFLDGGDLQVDGTAGKWISYDVSYDDGEQMREYEVLIPDKEEWIKLSFSFEGKAENSRETFDELMSKVHYAH